MITFVAYHDRASGKVRGMQIADRISGGQFVDLNSSVLKVQNEFVILTRNYNANFVKHLKSSGHIVGYDINDMPVGDVVARNEKYTFGGSSIKKYCHDECDFFIVNTDVAKSEVELVTAKPCFVIPHHNCNFDNEFVSLNSKVKRVGYVGLSEQLSKQTFITQFLHQLDIEFVAVHPTTRDECNSILKTLDIGIIYTDTDYFPNAQDAIKVSRAFKPNIKLANFQSYGIPTISVNYASYTQFGGEDAWIKIETLDELLQNIQSLITDDKLRAKISINSIINSKNYHVDLIAKQYENMIFSLKR